MQPALIGVDIGTTNIKAVAFALDGSQLGKASTPTLTHYPQPGWAYFEPDELWDAICTVLQRLTANLPTGVAPAAIAFSSMAEAAVPLDARGQPTYASIAWFDKRTQPQADWWLETIGLETTAQITGLPVKPVPGILKLLWLREHQPNAFAQTRHWLNMADYGVFRLCGVPATDYSLASRMLVLDLAQKAWSSTLLNAIDIPQHILGELVPSGQLLGHVHAAAATATGLPAGLPVCSGGHDHVCGAFALGLTEPGDVLDSMGTAEGIVLTTTQPRLDASVTARGIGQGIHVVPDRTYAMSGMNFSGGAVDWARQLLLGAASSGEASAQSFEALFALAKSAPMGSGGVFFVPHLRRSNPPVTDMQARGAFVGVTSDATTGDFARAVLEGVAYDFQRAFENMTDTFGVTPRRQVATGGGTRNELLMRIKAMVSGQAIVIPQVAEATCLGAAMLAGIGANCYSSFADASQQVKHQEQTVESAAEHYRFYRERYETVYLGLYDALRTTNHAIKKLDL